MYKQVESYRLAGTMTAGQTYILPLPTTGMLSGILMHLEATAVSNAFAATSNWRLIDYISKVEVVGNGATIIKSLTGYELQYLAFAHQAKVPPAFWRTYGANVMMEYLTVIFGRYLWDTQYGLDLSKWDTVELRVTNTNSATFFTGDITVDVCLDWLRESAGGFLGYIRSELWRQWAPVALGTQYFQLPTEFPISQVLLEGIPHKTTGMNDYNFWHIFGFLSFALGGGTKKVFEGTGHDLMIQNYLDDPGEVIQSGASFNNASQGVTTAVGRMMGWSAVAAGAAAGLTTFPSMQIDDTDETVKFWAHDGGGPYEWIVRGMAFYSHLHLWQSDSLDPESLLDPKVVGDVLLNITADVSVVAAAAIGNVILERVVTR